MRYFTSDFHFGSAIMLDKSIMHDKVRKFKNLDDMHNAILKTCSVLKSEDTLYHLGDFACKGNDRQIYKGLNSRAEVLNFFNKIPGNKVMIAGNHDWNNCTPITCDYMVIKLGKWTASFQHYPSNNIKAKVGDKLMNWPWQLNICGHVHSQWKVMYDSRHKTVNINVGLDKNNFKIYSEAELMLLIENVATWMKSGHKINYDTWSKLKSQEKINKKQEQVLKSLIWRRDNRPDLMTPNLIAKLEHILKVKNNVKN